jgi:hypothetical protein
LITTKQTSGGALLIQLITYRPQQQNQSVTILFEVQGKIDEKLPKIEELAA